MSSTDRDGADACIEKDRSQGQMSSKRVLPPARTGPWGQRRVEQGFCAWGDLAAFSSIEAFQEGPENLEEGDRKKEVR